MPRRLMLILVVAVAALVVGCSPSVRVQHDWDESFQFGEFASFDILETDSIRDQLVARRINDAVHVHLAERGYEKDPEDPDFLVAFHTNVADRIDVNSWGYSVSSRHWHGHRNVSVQQYQEGTLFIDLIDADEMELVWRGWGTVILNSSTREGHVIQDIVDRILKQYPPK